MRIRLGLRDAWSRYWASLRQQRLRRLEGFAASRPGLYVLLALLIGLSGYAFIFAWPLITALLIIDVLGNVPTAQQTGHWGLILIETAALALTGWISVRFAQMAPRGPSGLSLALDHAPRLAAEIDRLRERRRSPPIHEIRITQRFELEVVRVPSTVYPLRSHNVLLIGLPLLQASSPRQFSTWLALKLTQLSRTYLRPTGWIYFANARFRRYCDLPCSGWSPECLVLRGFFSWFAPSFDVISFYARRMDELRADAMMLSESSDTVRLVETLATQGAMRRYLENEFWPQYLKLSTRYAKPPYPPYGALARRVLKGLSARELEPWLNKALESEAGYVDPSPALAERIDALAQDRVDLVARTDGLAGPDLLGERYLSAVGAIDEQWVAENAAEWTARYHRNERIRRRFQLLQRQAADGMIADKDAWEYTLLLPRYFEDEALADRYKQLLGADPQDARVWFYIGRFLLQRRDADGVKALETAMTLDEQHTVAACRLITRFMVDTGAKKYAQFYRRKALAYQAQAA
jgi:hypothetical protein